MKANQQPLSELILASGSYNANVSSPNNEIHASSTNNEIQEPKIQIVKLLVFPPGARFVPSDHELIVYYLMKKVMNEPVPYLRITEIDLSKHNPQELSEKYDCNAEKEWYFYTPRDRKYRNGTRPNRAAGNGYWKATGADKSIHYGDKIVGKKKSLVYYEGKPPKGDKTNWIMHEYRTTEPNAKRRSPNDMRLDDWVLCRIYKKSNRSSKNLEQTENTPNISEEITSKLAESNGVDFEHSNELFDNDNHPMNMYGDHSTPPPLPNVLPSMWPSSVNFNSNFRQLGSIPEQHFHPWMCMGGNLWKNSGCCPPNSNEPFSNSHYHYQSFHNQVIRPRVPPIETAAPITTPSSELETKEIRPEMFQEDSYLNSAQLDLSSADFVNYILSLDSILDDNQFLLSRP